MKAIETIIPGVIIFEPTVFEDERGYFFESYNAQEFERLTGKNVVYVQDNQSCSKYGVIRGLHFQKPPFVQAKLVRVLRGAILDVAVDMRTGSPTFGAHVAVKLSSENKRQLFLPRGFAHGFSTLSFDGAEVLYKCDNGYSKDHESGVRYDDLQLAIDWQIPKEAQTFSTKDMQYGSLESVKDVFFYEA
ncbi:dTDP-4-dehydrorhamnose 3,5-epimerase [Candidatus Uhrbacteria bacterium]|nr:dTDP-4-dehydrorhamnose 3,5-epimerase [Candidatus Uhrbacteria bacterium]